MAVRVAPLAMVRLDPPTVRVTLVLVPLGTTVVDSVELGAIVSVLPPSVIVMLPLTVWAVRLSLSCAVREVPSVNVMLVPLVEAVSDDPLVTSRVLPPADISKVPPLVNIAELSATVTPLVEVTEILVAALMPASVAELIGLRTVKLPVIEKVIAPSVAVRSCASKPVVADRAVTD